MFMRQTIQTISMIVERKTRRHSAPLPALVDKKSEAPASQKKSRTRATRASKKKLTSTPETQVSTKHCKSCTKNKTKKSAKKTAKMKTPCKQKKTNDSRSHESMKAMTIAQLKADLRQRGLPVSGKKSVLIARLSEHMNGQSVKSAKSAKGRAASANSDSDFEDSPAPLVASEVRVWFGGWWGVCMCINENRTF